MTDNRRSEKLTWAFGSGEVKIYVLFHFIKKLGQSWNNFATQNKWSRGEHTCMPAIQKL